MFGKSLLLLGSTDDALRLPIVQSVLEHWPDDDQPQITRAVFADIVEEPESLRKCGAVWLLLDQPQAPDGFYDVVGLLQDRHIPALVSRPNETWSIGSTLQDGVIVAPPEFPPLAIYGMLRTVWAQKDMLQALQTEITILTAHQGGLCDQIGKMDEELRLASQLQREFLPQKLPEAPGIETSVLFRPASYVSGDIYDIMRLDEKHLGIFLGDAVGHGVPAALLTVYIQRSLHTKEVGQQFDSGYRIVPPNETLQRLNDSLVEHQAVKVRTATAAYGVLNTETNALQVARAGHPFPLVLRRNGDVEEMTPDGSILGVFPGESFELQTVQLEPGDRILFYSDGFEVAFRDPHSEVNRWPTVPSPTQCSGSFAIWTSRPVR